MSGSAERANSTNDDGAVPWHSKETNSVEAESSLSDDLDERVHERVIEFIEEYPELAQTPLCETHGRSLRRIVTDAEWQDLWVEPEREWEDAFQVTDLERRAAAVWSDALSAFLTAHTRYDGLLARFANGEGETFDVSLADAWGEEYSQKQYARALALQRQMAGGERPTGGTAVAAWDDAATAMITLTGSSVPDGTRVPPVEHLDALHDSYSYDGVRDTLRNTMEYHLGLDPEQWGYWLQAEPHGMSAASGSKEAGLNACYTHLHVGVYFDAAELDFDTVETELRRVVNKHVEVCKYASESAHRKAISLNADVENMGSYMATYMGGYTESLLDKPIEYLAWGAIYWSAARRRISRSKLLNAAIEADACEQRAEHERVQQTESHGESVVWNDGNGLDVECACCGSGWGIDQSRLDEPESDDDTEAVSVTDSDENPPEPEPLTLAERWPNSPAGIVYGENPSIAKLRSQIREYIEVHGSDVSIPQLMGELSVDPRHISVVREALAGEMGGEIETFSRVIVESEWHLEAIVDRDGEEHATGGGGIDMKPLYLPVERLLSETRLRHDLEKGEIFRCKRCNVASHNPKWFAYHVFYDYGIDDPEDAERLLHVEDHLNNERQCMRSPL